MVSKPLYSTYFKCRGLLRLLSSQRKPKRGDHNNELDITPWPKKPKDWMQTSSHKIMEISINGSNLINKWHIELSHSGSAVKNAFLPRLKCTNCLHFKTHKPLVYKLNEVTKVSMGSNKILVFGLNVGYNPNLDSFQLKQMRFVLHCSIKFPALP
jgi:hypothetical protein